MDYIAQDCIKPQCSLCSSGPKANSKTTQHRPHNFKTTKLHGPHELHKLMIEYKKNFLRPPKARPRIALCKSSTMCVKYCKLSQAYVSNMRPVQVEYSNILNNDSKIEYLQIK